MSSTTFPSFKSVVHSVVASAKVVSWTFDWFASIGATYLCSTDIKTSFSVLRLSDKKSGLIIQLLFIEHFTLVVLAGVASME